MRIVDLSFRGYYHPASCADRIVSHKANACMLTGISIYVESNPYTYAIIPRKKTIATHDVSKISGAPKETYCLLRKE